MGIEPCPKLGGIRVNLKANGAEFSEAALKNSGCDQSSITVPEDSLERQDWRSANARPYGIAINSKGIPFFCEFGTNKMAKIDPQTMAITEYKLPESARPRRMAINARDNVYFTDFQGGNLGRLDPASGAVRMWPSPGGSGSDPYGIAITPDGLVWYSESGVKPNSIIQFNPRTEQFARATIPSGGGTVRHMAATADGRVYIACSGVNKVGVGEPAR
jgi:virginiamycin B lyase